MALGLDEQAKSAALPHPKIRNIFFCYVTSGVYNSSLIYYQHGHLYAMEVTTMKFRPKGTTVISTLVFAATVLLILGLIHESEPTPVECKPQPLRQMPC